MDSRTGCKDSSARYRGKDFRRRKDYSANCRHKDQHSDHPTDTAHTTTKKTIPRTRHSTKIASIYPPQAFQKNTTDAHCRTFKSQRDGLEPPMPFAAVSLSVAILLAYSLASILEHPATRTQSIYQHRPNNATRMLHSIEDGIAAGGNEHPYPSGSISGGMLTKQISRASKNGRAISTTGSDEHFQ